MSLLTQDAGYDTWSTLALTDSASRAEFITQVATAMSAQSGTWDSTLLQGSTASPLEAAPADTTPSSPPVDDHKSFPLVMIIVMVAVVLVVLSIAVAVWRYRRNAPPPRPRTAAVQRVNPLQAATRAHAASSSVVPQISTPAVVHPRPRLSVPE
jgi:heme/copper-type cytochrome/quinol oxidase subunit 2